MVNDTKCSLQMDFWYNIHVQDINRAVEKLDHKQPGLLPVGHLPLGLVSTSAHPHVPVSQLGYVPDCVKSCVRVRGILPQLLQDMSAGVYQLRLEF